MEAKDIVKALETLAERGWPLEVFETYRSSENLHYNVILDAKAEVYIPFGFALPDMKAHRPLSDKYRWWLMGWLVAQLEARGLRRSVVPFAPASDFAATHWRVTVLGAKYEASTELEALLAACVSLPALLTDTQQTTPQGETTAAGDSYPAPPDPAIQPVPVEEDRF